MKQHNGYSSCTWCFITCEYIDNCVRYISSSPVEERTSALVVRDCHLALELDTDINGVKGPTPMMNLPGFDLVRGCSVEYMHSVLLGVTRQVNEYLFSSSHSSERQYIGSRAHLSAINSRVLSIKPPHCITRLPRSISDRAHWKAPELRSWLLFYSMPCTVDILPREYWRHMAKLSKAVHIPLRENISDLDITHADELLREFVGRCIPLYGEAFMTFNVHALLHLAASVAYLGPLWAHSAFVFEGGNGMLVNLVTAARGAPQQITERVVMHQELQTALALGRVANEEKVACQRLLGFAHIQTASYAGDVCMMGHGRAGRLSSTEVQALEQFLGSQVGGVVEHDRLIYCHQVFNSAAYSRPTKSDSTVFVDCYGQYQRIETILELRVQRAQKCLLICRKVVACVPSRKFPPHIKECFLSERSDVNVIEPHCVRDICLFMSFPTGQSYVCDLPNKIERD
ncbi:uncharacterized protein LOC135371716 isoform X1 [Ornithodoros turicata]|uniref:uncharacterized protein LOC135371716 isoform X1 n=1 Tax=Ornithodoros turicata TaxID=34597 RepID=UPI003139848E